MHAAQIPTLYEHCTPASGTEADEATWDEENHSIITPLEAQANQEETEVANISWLVDLASLDAVDESAEVKFQDGTGFNFDGELSIQTTWTAKKTAGDDDDSMNNSKPASKP